jgi:dihydroorotate dehydrogenase
MYRLVRALLFLLPPELAHAVAMLGLRLLGRAAPVCRSLRRLAALPDLTTRVAGLSFPTPIGLAAGLDKDGVAVAALFGLGFGFVEVGTITPRPQPGNSRPRLHRLRAQGALVNRMGFNNHGAAAAARRLARLRFRPAPLGVNIGKNRDTPLEHAAADYVACAEALGDVADFLVVNASSPNTPCLRALQEPERLGALLATVLARTAKPVFLKIAPDLAPEAIDAAVDTAAAAGAAGLICTNTTVAHGHGEGGLSGRPLRDPSTEVVRRAYRRAAGRLPIIGVGGVFSPEDAYAKIRAGASLVEVYTGFIYEGPGLAARLARGLAALLARDGLTLADAVGKDA